MNKWGRRLIGISGTLIWSKSPVVNFGEVRRAQLAKSNLLTSTLVPLGFFQICSDAKKRVGCGKQRETTAPTHPW